MADGSGAARQSAILDRVLRQTSAYAALRATAGLATWGAFVVLSRLLDQRSFGAFEIGMFYIGVGQILGDGGLAASLVRRPGEVARIEYQTALSCALALAAGLALLLVVFAPWIGAANGLTEHEIWALRALAPLYLVPALRLVPYAKLERAVDFAGIGRIELGANLARLLTALGVAWLFGGVWALAISQLVLAAVQVTLAYRKAPGWVGLGFSRRAFFELYDYGSKVQASIFFIHLKTNLAAALLGPLLGPPAVGVFKFATELVRAPADVVSSLARVQFPVYAALDPAGPELSRVFRGTLRGALRAGLPVLGVLALGAQWLIPVVYGPKWQAALPVVWALVPHVASDLLMFHAITFVQGRGRAGLALLIYASWSGLLWCFGAAALTLSGGSLTALAGSLGAASGLVLLFVLLWCGRYLQGSVVRDLYKPLAAFGIAFGAGLLAGHPVNGALATALASVLAFLGVFGAACWALEREAFSADVRAALRARS